MTEVPPRPSREELHEAMRRARLAFAERGERASDLRSEERGRLEALLGPIRDLLAQAGHGAEMFDVGLTQGFPRRDAPGRPRLFLDALAYVETKRLRGFRLVQDSRHGRLVLGEADDAEAAMRLVVDYMARRLVERERALDADQTVEEAARRLIGERSSTALAPGAQTPLQPSPNPSPHPSRQPPETPAARPTPLATAATAAPAPPAATRAAEPAGQRAQPPRRGPGLAERGLLFTIQLLGSAALTLIVALAMWWAWKIAAAGP